MAAINAVIDAGCSVILGYGDGLTTLKWSIATMYTTLLLL